MFIVALRSLIIFLVLGLLLPACSPSNSNQPLTKVTLQLNRMHGVQLGGFYAAIEKGYYANEGLEVSFTEGGGTIDPLASVVDGTAQFGVAGGDVVLLGRASGKPVRAIATILRREPFVFFSLASSGITRPEDFVGKKVLVSSASRPRLHTMLGKVGIPVDEVSEVTTGDFTGLYDKTIDVAGGFVSNTVLQVQRAGYPVNIIYLDNYGIHFYSDTLFASDDLINSNPDLVERFLRASIEGWSYALEHTDEIAAMTLKYNPELNADLETAKMAASLPYVNTGEDHIGWMKPEIWDGMVQVLREQGILTVPLDASDVYTMRFIEELYGDDS